MKNSLFLLFFFSFCVSSTPAPELLFKINRSVVKVNVSNKEGNHGVGSGVVVKKDHIVTNCHVIADAQGINVNKYGKTYIPDAIIADWKNDVCILKFKYLELEPIKLSSNDSLEYETKVFGKSYGGNTVKPHTSFGRVKGIHQLNQFKVIQSSAWFAMGASGGGLFNYKGELIAITTFKTAGNTAFYYSMPVEIIKDILINFKETAITTQPELPFWDAPPIDQPYFMQVIGPMQNESWKTLKKITLEWLKEAPNEIEAQYHHAFALYQLGELVTAKNILRKVIKKNKKHALAYLYLLKISIKENQSDDMSYYKSKVLELDNSLMSQ
ncbi:serine protease [Methylophilaceae bacterium]|jgi:serine protease Do|nr:serine protease [Methylophilaceae bacterium]|tara:strand:- start:994 stop:1971 length:978 start_codon:yes stop_codon:yes gene_type:complete